MLILYIFLTLFIIALCIVFLCHYNIYRLPKSFKYPRILMYHSVCNDLLSGMNINSNKFEKHIKYLIKRKFKFEKISQILSNNVYKAVAITFDDGFENNYINVFPILQKYQIPATIYISPKINNITKLQDFQIQEMIESELIEFASHTLNHVNLTNISLKEAEVELIESKKYIENKYNIACNHFAYPFGRFNKDIEYLVQKAGYLSAVTTKKRVFNKNKDSIFAIPRISTHGKMNIFQFAIAITVGRYKI